MKNKLLWLVIVMLLLVSCNSKQDKQESLECSIGDTVITITVEKGKIIRYYDKVTGELPSEKIDILNKNHLEDINDNEQAIVRLREVIASSGGDCQY